VGNVIDIIRRAAGMAEPQEERSLNPISFEDVIAQYFSYNGVSYPLSQGSTLGQNTHEVGIEFASLAEQAYKQNGVIFACMLVRQLLFSEARFQYRRRSSGRPGELFGSDALALLENPWPGGTTGDLLTRSIQDADLAGNSFNARMSGGIRRLRPDWTDIVLGSRMETTKPGLAADAEVIGYLYHPGGRDKGGEPLTFLREEVAHFAPIPDPTARFRGMSWLTPVIREIRADFAMTDHQRSYMEKGATPNMIIKLDPSIEEEAFDTWVRKFREGHEGAANAYKTLFLGGGADGTVVGSNLEQITFKEVRGSGETRIAAAAGVPPVIVGLSEGLAAATYSNYGQARRRFADGTMRPLWRGMAGALASIVPVPNGAELWYDDRDIPFLQEDVKDEADINFVHAQAIRSLTEAGYEPNSVVDAITSGDLTRLNHTGVYSVQLQPPGSGKQEPADDPSPTNGRSSTDAALRALEASARQ